MESDDVFDSPPIGDDGFGSAKGMFLVAHPNLKDPNFRRRVVYMAAHDTDGALGIVINAPMGSTLGKILPDVDQPESMTEIPIFLGGPVGTDRLIISYLHWASAGTVSWDWLDKGDQALLVELDMNAEKIEALSNKRRSAAGAIGIRAFVGYAGWGGGQLESELDRGDWLLVKPKKKHFAPKAPEDRQKSHFAGIEPTRDRTWFRIVNELGTDMKLQAAIPDRLELN